MLYGRLYVVLFENVSISATQDLFEITPATNKPVVLHRLTLSNVGGTSDAGDAQEEDLLVSFRYGYTTSGSGGTAPTPVAKNPADASAGFSAEVNNTTVATTGTATTFGSIGWNVRQREDLLWAPEHRFVVTAAQTRAVVRLVNAPADAISCSGELLVEEIG
jgi:hypothetical protein